MRFLEGLTKFGADKWRVILCKTKTLLKNQLLEKKLDNVCTKTISWILRHKDKSLTEKAFHDFLPPSVVIDIKSKRVVIAKMHHYK
mgnify:CR=1 FL=1